MGINNKMYEIREKVINRAKNKDIFEAGEITREEYYYSIGRTLDWLQRGLKDKRYRENIAPILDTSNVEVLKKLKLKMFKKYIEYFFIHTYAGSLPYNIAAISFSYEADSYTKEDKKILEFGYLDRNYFANIKEESASNE